jgi:hypothetical protein
MYRKNPDEFTDLFPGPYISARGALMAEGADGEIMNDEI